MSVEPLEYFRELLLKKKAELLQGAEKVFNEELMVDQEERTDYIYRSCIEAGRSFHIRLKDRERKLIKKIDAALGRIDDGTFGKCDACGKSIGEKRLKARPVATLCINCKEAQEKDENLRE